MSDLVWTLDPGDAAGRWQKPTGGGGSSPVQSATVTLTSAQLLALFDTPVQLVASPGAGKMIVPSLIVLNYRAGATPYTDNGGNLTIYAGDIGATWSQLPTAGFWDQATSQVDGNGPSQNGMLLSDYEALPLLLAQDTADPTDGDGTLVVTVIYATVTVA